MKKCELLSPAGSMEMLKFAVQNGAAAVYLAGTKFGARKYATNFNNEEIEEAIKYAHLYGVKVYITINTIIFDDEIEEFIDYVRYIHKINVDAVLVQDFGMLNMIHEMFPNLELHASTQMHNNGTNMCELLKKCGVSRVVLDREMSMAEIKTLPKDIEKEVFCHGALCVSYSGQCLFSSKILGRSGNRGECAGMCRLPYKTDKNDKEMHYLSLKDLCTVDFVDKLIESGVDSLKIEGRLKSPEYVGYITKIYRKQIDKYYTGDFSKVSDIEKINMMLLFYRGFTNGFISDAPNEEMANIKSPNHLGIVIGKYSIYKNKVALTLDEELTQGDKIRFENDQKGMTVNFLYDKNDNLIKCGHKNETIYIDNFLEIKNEGILRKTSSIKLIKEIDDLPVRKVKVSAVISILAGKKINLKVSDGNNLVEINRIIPSDAINKPISKQDVLKQIMKTGNTVFEFDNVKINLDDNLFVNIKDLNELRREALEQLEFERKNKEENFIEKDFKFIKTDFISSIPCIIKIRNIEQYKAIEYKDVKIMVSDKKLYEIIKNDSRVILKLDENSKITNLDKYVISDLGSIDIVKKNDLVISDYMLNIVNSISCYELSKRGVSLICLSPELSYEQIVALKSKYSSQNLQILIYGKIELMKMKYKPLSENEKLIDRNNKKYNILSENNFNYLMGNKNLDLSDKIAEFKNIGISNFRIDLLEESAEETKILLQKMHKLIYEE